MMKRLSFFCLLIVVPTSCFVSQGRNIKNNHGLAAKVPTPDESAQALTDFMAKAHEEKIRAMADVEKQCNVKVKALQEKIVELEGNAPVRSGENSFDMPATNKALTKKVGEYRSFIEKYIVSAQKERVEAVAVAENNMKAKYEAIIAELKKGEDKPAADKKK